MHKEKIVELRAYAAMLREKILLDVQNEAFHTVEEKECSIAAIQFLPLFAEAKPLDEYYSPYLFMVKRKVLEAFERMLPISTDTRLLEAYNILKLTSFCGPFPKEEINYAELLKNSIEDVSKTPYVLEDFDTRHPFFGDTENHYKHHRKKTIFEKRR